MTESPLAAHVHCRSCGREMHPGALICLRCEALGIRMGGAGSSVAAAREAPAVSAPANGSLRAPPVSEALGAAAAFPRPPRAVHRRPYVPRLATVPVPAVPPAPPTPPAPRTPTAPPPAVVVPPAPKATAATAAVPARAPPTSAGRSAPARRRFRPIDLWKRYLPPVRLVWISLGILLALGDGFVSAARAGPLIAVPLIGAITDLGFQRVRFPRLRFPDAALATSLFLSLIIWPSDVSLPLVSIAIASIGLRHFVRTGGHPWFNPAAAGLSLATVLFALPTSWHVGLTTSALVAIVVLGVLLIARAPHAWRIPVAYFAAYFVTLIALTVAVGAAGQLASAITLEGLSGASLFFGFFMVTEPRTAPSARRAMLVFGALVGVVAAGFPVLFAELPVVGALGVIAPFLALFVGNAFTMILPSARGSRRSAPATAVGASG